MDRSFVVVSLKVLIYSEKVMTLLINFSNFEAFSEYTNIAKILNVMKIYVCITIIKIIFHYF